MFFNVPLFIFLNKIQGKTFVRRKRRASYGCFNPYVSFGDRSHIYIIDYFSTHPLIFARFYWLLYGTWCKITGQLSRNNPSLRGYLSSDYFRRKETKQAGKSQLKSFTFSSLLFYMEEKQTRFVKYSDGEIKKLVANAVPESTKKSTKYAVKVFQKVKKVTSRLSDCESLFHMTVFQVLEQSQ